MLSQLIVENVALVDRVELDFSAGMSVITGETGAGKSIMLDALGLALGDRAESALIADHTDKAEVHARFDISGNDAALAWLSERELQDEAGECILRRIATRDGRSRGFINGVPATAADMKALGDLLIDIHSQHEHQSLLKRDTQRRLLDEFGASAGDAAEVRSACEAWQEARLRLSALIAGRDEQSARRQLLEYQAAELEALGATDGEAAALEAEQRLLANAESVLQSVNDAIALSTGDDSDNAVAGIARAVHLLESARIDALRPIIEMLESARIQIEEAGRDLARFADSVELDPSRLAEVEARLGNLYDIARKHRIDPKDIPALQTRIDEELAGLDGTDDDIARLEEQLGSLEADYAERAQRLGQKRRKAAKALQARVTAQLGRLGMQGASFAVSLTPRDDAEPAPNGMEDVEFLIVTNPGQPPRPLNRIASGGELSRISLAIQVVTADTSRVPTMVFDEVDVGIGGAVAEVVGALLRKLGGKAQIVCVTHLPQVAAQGNHHFLVTKASGRAKATTRIERLSAEDKVVEIARMLGGIEVTEQSMAHARQMFSAAQGVTAET